MSQVKLIVGLGNPGDRYRNTPHNIGFEVLDRFAERHGLRFRRAFGLHAGGVSWQKGGSSFQFLKPSTYMNRSGVSVRKALKHWKWDPSETLVVFDDVELPLGALRIRKKGGAGGHNGVASVVEELDNRTDFSRLRLGVGPRPSGDRLIPYLLGTWNPELATEVAELRERGADALEIILRDGVEAAMNQLNTRRDNPSATSNP